MNNSISTLLYILALLSLGGGILSGLYYSGGLSGNFYLEIAIPYFIYGLVSFGFFMSLSEIIKLLQGIYFEIKDKQELN